MQAVHQRFEVGLKGIIARGDRVLVLRARASEHWELPGGRIQKGESIMAALKREMREELPGADKFRVERFVHAQEGQFPLSKSVHLMLIVFHLELDAPAGLQPGPDHEALRWINREALTALPLLGTDRQALLSFFGKRN